MVKSAPAAASIDWLAFIHARTSVESPPLLPDIKLHLAHDVSAIWKAVEEACGLNDAPPPYWAFAWPGGQAVARYILDHPDRLRGKRVLDMASGSGLGAFAAAKAGAKHVTAVDIDPIALVAIADNARLNQVDLTIRNRISLDKAPWRTDVVIAGDVCYEQPMAALMIRWLRLCCEKGITVLLADPGRIYLPDAGLRALQTYKIQTSRELEDSDERDATVYELFIPE